MSLDNKTKRNESKNIIIWKIFEFRSIEGWLGISHAVLLICGAIGPTSCPTKAVSVRVKVQNFGGVNKTGLLFHET